MTENEHFSGNLGREKGHVCRRMTNKANSDRPSLLIPKPFSLELDPDHLQLMYYSISKRKKREIKARTENKDEQNGSRFQHDLHSCPAPLNQKKMISKQYQQRHMISTNPCSQALCT